MFLPFLAAAAVATAFAQLGAMSVKIAVLTALLKAMSVALLAVASGVGFCRVGWTFGWRR